MTTTMKAQHPRGMEEISEQQWHLRSDILRRICEVCESYGFAPLETGLLEYADALGAFLPDTEQPHQGVFSLQDGEKQLALRYDLTAPLARYVAENFDALPKPFRRYQAGAVLRNEKPGEGRFRQFTQIDADTLGAPPPAADAEMCMLMSDCLAQAGISREAFCVRVNNRKILDGALNKIGVNTNDQTHKAHIMRALDKYDRLGSKGVRLLLGEGRRDPSGDFTQGAGLAPAQIDTLIAFLEMGSQTSREQTCAEAEKIIGNNDGINELRQMDKLFAASQYDEDRITFDASIVRGLGYYTGPVFEAVSQNFGALGGGGRYDDLLQRFRGEPVPATGMSIGLSRLHAFIQQQEKPSAEWNGPIIVLVMEKERMSDYLNMTAQLRHAGLRAETYMGVGNMRAQLKYADKRRAPLAIIQGEDERSTAEITIKDLAQGAEQAASVSDNQTWRASQHAQVKIKYDDLVQTCLQKINDARIQKK